MPQALALIGITTTWAAIGSAIATSLISGIVSAGLSMLARAVAGGNSNLSAPGRQLTFNEASNVQSVPVVYGLQRIAGARVFAHTTSEDNKDLYLVFVLAEGGHPSAPNTDMCDGVVNHFFDGISSLDVRWTSLNTINTHLGADNQTADTMLTAACGALWDTNYRLRGLCYTAVHLIMPDPDPDTGEVPWTNLPVVSTLFRGRKVYDCRVGAGQTESNAATWTYSTNPALCILDYLRDARYGKGIAASEIDLTSFSTAADYCDDLVNIPGGGTQKRYECHGRLDTGRSIINNMRDLLSSCRGMLVWSAGKYQLIIDKPESVSAFDFDESTIVGAWQISFGERAQRYNQVKAQFINPAKAYQPDFITVASSSFKTQDKSEDLTLEIELPFTANAYTARHLATIELKQSRNLIRCSFTATTDCLKATAGSKVTITHASLGWVAKEFRVTSIELLYEGEVKVTCVEYDDDAYTLDSLNLDDTAGDTVLPNPRKVKAPTNLVLTTGASVALVLEDGTVQARIKASWDASTDRFTDHYEVQWKLSTESQWASAKVAAAQVVYLIPMVNAGAAYDVRVRAVNTINAKSPWVVGSTTAAGKNVAPGRPGTLTATPKVGAISLAWTNPTDPDLGAIEIYESATSSFADATLIASLLADKFYAPVPEGATRWYWIRALDTSRNTSEYRPLTSSAGATATAQSVSPDAIFDLIRDVASTAWRHTFDDEQWTREPFTDSAGTVTRSGTDFYLGDGSGQFVSSGGSTQITGYFNLPPELIGAWSNKRVRVSLWYKQQAGNGSASTAIRFYDHVGSVFDSGLNLVVPSGAWQRVDFIVPVGSAAKNGRFAIYADRNGTNKGVMIDSVVIDMVPDIISAANIDEYFANLAVGNAYIANAAISNAKMQTASISTANIIDANVTTLKIGGNNVTIPLAASSASFQKTSGVVVGTFYDVTGLTVTLPSATAGTRGLVVCMVGCSKLYANEDDGWEVELRLMRDGIEIGYRMTGVWKNGPGLIMTPPILCVDAPNNSSHVYKLQAKLVGSTSVIRVFNPSLVVLEAKR